MRLGRVSEWWISSSGQGVKVSEKDDGIIKATP